MKESTLSPGQLPIGILLFACLTALISSCAPNLEDPFVLSALLETEPVASDNDAADDPAIWVHPSDPEASLIIGTDKGYGVEVYNLEGARVQRIAAGNTNNIDLRPLPMPWPKGSAILAASNRSGNTISLFMMSADGVLSWLSDSEISTGLTEIYGACLYAQGETLYAFVNDKDGRYQQWLLELVASVTSSSMSGTATLVREFSFVVNNLFDESYLGGIAAWGAWIGAPRTASFAMTVDF